MKKKKNPIYYIGMTFLIFCILLSPSLIIPTLIIYFIYRCAKKTTRPKKPTVQVITNICPKCHNENQETDYFCTNCGLPLKHKENISKTNAKYVHSSKIYLNSSRHILKDIIQKELRKKKKDPKTFENYYTKQKKNTLLIIFVLLTMLLTFLYFFNLSPVICLLTWTIIFIIYLILSHKYDITKIIYKKALKNPDTDIISLVNSAIDEEIITFKNRKVIVILSLVISILIPCLIFIHPKIIYLPNEEGYTLFRYTKSLITKENITIPKTYNHKKVTIIAQDAFRYSKFKTITIPNTIEKIEASAFANNSNLTTVNLNKNLKEIRGKAFKDCPKLTNIILPDSLTYLGGSAFKNDSSLTEITIPKKVTEIHGNTFENCKSLKTVNLHNNIKSIHAYAFKNNTNLKNIILPDKITKISEGTFEGCTSLEKIIVPNKVTKISAHAFTDCQSLSEVTIPSSVKEIGSSAFRRCYNLKEISIPYNAVVNSRAFKESYTNVKRY